MKIWITVEVPPDVVWYAKYQTREQTQSNEGCNFSITVFYVLLLYQIMWRYRKIILSLCFLFSFDMYSRNFIANKFMIRINIPLVSRSDWLKHRAYVHPIYATSVEICMWGTFNTSQLAKAIAISHWNSTNQFNAICSFDIASSIYQLT